MNPSVSSVVTLDKNVAAIMVGMPLVLQHLVGLLASPAHPQQESDLVLGSVAKKWFARLAVSIVERTAKFAIICC